MPDRETLIPAHGGYRKLKSFPVAQLANDIAIRLCDRSISPRRRRTHDQMVPVVQAKDFAENGGFPERQYRVRSRPRQSLPMKNGPL